MSLRILLYALPLGLLLSLLYAGLDEVNWSGTVKAVFAVLATALLVALWARDTYKHTGG